MTAKQYVPALRFPEFKEEWNTSTLSEIAKIERGRFSPRPRNNPIYYGGNIPFVQTSDVTNSGGRVNKFSQTLNEKGLQVSKLFPKGTILITIAANIGFTGVLEIDMACPDSLVGIVCGKNIYNYYLNYYLFIKQSKIDYLAPQGAQRNINIEFLNPFEIEFPSLPEQQKIAAFLTAVDDKIQQLTRKKALLEQYKKGAMQQIFSQQLRFKDDAGNDFPDWEEKTLGEIVSFPQTNSFSRSQLNYENGEVKNIHYGDIHTKFKTHFYINREAVPFINTDIDLSKIPIESYCKEGDLVIADASEDYKDVGKAIEIIDLNNERLVAGLHTYIARPISNISAKGFLSYAIQMESVRLQIMKMATGISVLGISKGNLQKVIIHLPVVAEQQKIASFLSAIDEKINHVTTQLQHTQQWKKGLLQQMFV